MSRSILFLVMVTAPQSYLSLKILSRSFTPIEQRRTRLFWTAKRLRESIPIPMPIYRPDKVDTYNRELKPDRVNLKNAFKELHKNISVGGFVGRTSRESDYGIVTRADVSKFPWQNAGTLHTRINSTHNGICTAQFVGHRRVILTAAHCIIDTRTGRLHDHIIFYQKDKDTKRNKKHVSAKLWYYDGYWQEPGKSNLALDYAFLNTLTSSPSNQNAYIGFHSPLYYSEATAIGYSGASQKLHNQDLFKVHGHLINRQHPQEAVMINNPFYKGASGGAWLATHKANNGTVAFLAVGLNCRSNLGESRGIPGFVPKMYSAVFNKKTNDLLLMAIHHAID